MAGFNFVSSYARVDNALGLVLLATKSLARQSRQRNSSLFPRHSESIAPSAGTFSQNRGSRPISHRIDLIGVTVPGNKP